MVAVLQRVRKGKVTVNGKITGEIGSGLVVLLGVYETDSEKEADRLADKTVNLRIFGDEDSKMNLSLLDVAGEALVVSQFTLCANSRKGRRPSFVAAAEPKKANELYEYFVSRLKAHGIETQTGVFGAMMDVELVNDGPVTIVLDTDDLM